MELKLEVIFYKKEGELRQITPRLARFCEENAEKIVFFLIKNFQMKMKRRMASAS